MNRAFEMDDVAAMELLDAVGVGDLVVPGADGLEAVRLPFVVDEDADDVRVLGHVARANPIWRLASVPIDALLIVHGPEAYVSPTWYASKRVDGRVVPTWNHVTVHVRGSLSVLHDDDVKTALVRRLTDRFESGRSPAWSVDDAPEEFVASMVRGIVGLEMAVTELVGIAKLSQNRSDEDRAGVTAGLRGGSPADGAVAELMDAGLGDER